MFKKPNIISQNVRGFKVKLYPTDNQKQIFLNHMDLFRFIYNWGLEKSQEYYKEHGEYIGKVRLQKLLSEYRNNTPWLKNIPLHSARLALEHLDFAYKGFFKNETRFPRFKSKKSCIRKVHYRNETYAFNFDDNSVRISGFGREERILCKSHNVPPPIISGYYNCTVTFDGIDFWLSVNTEVDRSYLKDEELSEESIGIDLGICKFAQLSNGIVYQRPKILNTIDKRIRKQQSRLSKMRRKRYDTAKQTITKFEDIPCTKNELKLIDQNIKLRIRRKNIMRSFLHQTTTEIANMRPKRIVVEDLNVSEFIRKSKKMNNKTEIYHSMWYKFREYLTYKSIERGIEFIVADRNFPSSQICSNCGSIKKSSYRTHICPVCGLRIDRDLNAAINLSRYA